MGILKSLIKVIKGGLNDAGESIIDKNLIRILEQDIRDDDVAIRQAKQSLSGLKATEINMKRKIDSFKQDILDYERKAMHLLDIGNEELAEEVSERIVEIEVDCRDITDEYDRLVLEVKELNKLIKNRSKNYDRNKRELEKIKTVGELQKTTSSINKNFSSTNSTGNSVKESLARIKDKQQQWKDKQVAGVWIEEEMNNSDLDKKLLNVNGINKSSYNAKNVLERLKKKRHD